MNAHSKWLRTDKTVFEDNAIRTPRLASCMRDVSDAAKHTVSKGYWSHLGLSRHSMCHCIEWCWVRPKQVPQKQYIKHNIRGGFWKDDPLPKGELLRDHRMGNSCHQSQRF